jgi:hypothetical protein
MDSSVEREVGLVAAQVAGFRGETPRTRRRKQRAVARSATRREVAAGAVDLVGAAEARGDAGTRVLLVSSARDAGGSLLDVDASRSAPPWRHVDSRPQILYWLVR